MIASRNSSRLPSRAMWRMIQGSSLAPSRNMEARKTVALSPAWPSWASPAEGSFMSGRTMTMGTMARSWTMSMPIITLLDRVPSQPWFMSVLSSTMVLERLIMAPNQTEVFRSQPMSLPMPRPRPMVNPICTGVPIRAMYLTGLRSLCENSSPRANSKSATPISASRSMSCTAVMVRPPVCGPRMTPARM